MLSSMFSHKLFWKLLDHNYTQSSFSTIMRHFDNKILKDTLELKIPSMLKQLH